MSGRASQRGQALLLLLGFVAALCSAFVFVIAAGQVTSDKLRLINAADAAVLSAATWEARSLNLEATINRAIVANEAAIAQSVSLRSWFDYVNTLLPNINTVLQFIPYAGAAMRVLQRVWRGINTAAQASLRTAEVAGSGIDQELAITAGLVHVSAAQTAHSLAQAAVAAADMPTQLTRGGQELLDRDGPRWLGLTRLYAGRARQRQFDLIWRATDRFTQQRNFTLSALGGQIARIEKRGGTEMQDYSVWHAADTQSLHSRFLGVFGSLRERIPLGWGAAQAGSARVRTGSYGGSARVNPSATRRALSAAVRNIGYLGIPALSDVIALPRQSPEHRLALRLQTRRANAPTLYSDAAAVVRYRRPEARYDRARELGNLYEPYWQARLAPLNAADRQLADARDGINAASRGLAP